MIKLLSIIGARPSFIKSAAVSRAIKNFNEQGYDYIKEIIVHTGQHYDINMSDIFFEEMDIPKPDHLLGINGLNHGAMTGQMLEKIEIVLLAEKPHAVIVYGDTNTTLAGALAAVKLHIPLVHVEAGLRSFNQNMPEEINRVITDHISGVLFCPTQTAIDNLEKEGIIDNTKNSNGPRNIRVLNSGDVMLDAALFYSQISEKKAKVFAPDSELKKNLAITSKNRGFALVTVHRAENTDNRDRLSGIMKALSTLCKHLPVVFPIHPRTRKYINLYGLEKILAKKEILTIDPVGYFDILELLKHCTLVLTDSGGLQKEAYFFQKPCITLRDETEWVELVDTGTNILASADTNKILDAIEVINNKQLNFDLQIYGGGKASEQIIDFLMKYLDAIRN